MTSAPSKPPLNWLQHHSDHLDILLGQVRLLRRITDTLRKALVEPLASHCIAANIDGETLVVGCDTSAWAAKLRFQIPQLLDRLKAETDLQSLRQIRIRVQPLNKEPSRTTKRRFRLSEHSAALIASIADNTADPELKAALRRLSQRTKLINKP
jgi:hypothetical protein